MSAARACGLVSDPPRAGCGKLKVRVNEADQTAVALVYDADGREVELEWVQALRTQGERIVLELPRAAVLVDGPSEFNLDIDTVTEAATDEVAEIAFEAYRKKLGELNAGKAMTGSPMPPWNKVSAKRPDEPGGHVAACWRAVAEAIGLFNDALARAGRAVDVVAVGHGRAHDDIEVEQS